MRTFIIHVTLVTTALLVATLVISRFIPQLQARTGAAVIALMAANALVTVLPIHLFPNKNMLLVYLASMAVRVVFVAAALVAILILVELPTAGRMGVSLTAMVAFVAFQVVEIRHFLSLQKPETKT